MGITSSGPRHPDQASGQPGAQRRGSELQTLSPTWLGVEGGGSPDLSSPPGNLDGAIARGSGGGSAGGRHLAQAPGQPGAACAPLGEQAPPFAALIRHRTGGGWIFGVFSIRRQSSTERGRGRWESRPRDPGTRTRPRGSPGQHARLWASKRCLSQLVSVSLPAASSNTECPINTLKNGVPTPCTNTHTHSHEGACVPSFEIKLTHTHTHTEGGGRQGRCGEAQIR